MVKRKVNFSMLCLLDGVFPIPISTIVPLPRQGETPIGASRWAWLTLCAVTALLTCVMLCRVAKKRKQLTHVICTAIAEQFAVVVVVCFYFLPNCSRKQRRRRRSRGNSNSSNSRCLLSLLLVACGSAAAAWIGKKRKQVTCMASSQSQWLAIEQLGKPNIKIEANANADNSLFVERLWLLLEGDKTKPMSSVETQSIWRQIGLIMAQRDDKSKGQAKPSQTENKARPFSLSIHSDYCQIDTYRQTNCIIISSISSSSLFFIVMQMSSLCVCVCVSIVSCRELRFLDLANLHVGRYKAIKHFFLSYCRSAGSAVRLLWAFHQTRRVLVKS